MNEFVLEKLPQEQVELIVQFIDEKRSEPELKEFYVNSLLREDILNLLDQYCTVVYYPSNENVEEENNGFHSSYPLLGKEIDIVYINTNQSREKQIFTAAHELGHIWKVDQYIQSKLGLQFDYKQQEKIVNRFAAELLMPAELCERFIRRKLDAFPHADNKMMALDLLRTIVAVMNEYFVPYKSVVRRYYELNVIPYESARILYYGEGNLTLSVIQDFIEATAKEEGHSRLFQVDQRKWIEGLKELLNQAEENDLIPAPRIKRMRKQFGLDIPVPNEVLRNSVLVEKKGRTESNAETGRY